MGNLDEIKKSGMDSWLKSQRDRRLLVENLLDNYNEGRSMSFYCKASIVLPVKVIKKAIKEAIKKFTTNKIYNSDIKLKAKILKAIIQEMSSNSGTDLRLLK